MSADEHAAEADARQQLAAATTRRLQRLRRLLIGTSAWAAAMLLTVTHVHGWWSAGAIAAGVDVDAAELTFWTLLTGALALAAAMLLPQILTWARTPSGHVSDRAIRQLLDVEARRDRPGRRPDAP